MPWTLLGLSSDQGLNLCPWQWTCRVLTTRQPGNYMNYFSLTSIPWDGCFCPILLMKKWRLKEVVNVVQLFVGKDLNRTFQINRRFWLDPSHSAVQRWLLWVCLGSGAGPCLGDCKASLGQWLQPTYEWGWMPGQLAAWPGLFLGLRPRMASRTGSQGSVLWGPGGAEVGTGLLVGG